MKESVMINNTKDNQIRGELPIALIVQAATITDVFGNIRGSRRKQIKVSYLVSENIGKFEWRHYAPSMGFWVLRLAK